MFRPAWCTMSFAVLQAADVAATNDVASLGQREDKQQRGAACGSACLHGPPPPSPPCKQQDNQHQDTADEVQSTRQHQCCNVDKQHDSSQHVIYDKYGTVYLIHCCTAKQPHLKPMSAMSVRISSATMNRKLITCSGWPANLARSSGSCAGGQQQYQQQYTHKLGFEGPLLRNYAGGTGAVGHQAQHKLHMLRHSLATDTGQMLCGACASC